MRTAAELEFEQAIREMVLADAVAQLPPAVRAIYDDVKLRRFVTTRHAYVAHTWVLIPAAGYTPTPAVKAEAEQLFASLFQPKE